MDIFLITLLFLIFFIYLGYPAALVLLSSVFGKSVEQSEEEFPSVNLLVVVNNEEEFIESKILNCLELDYPREKLEIVIVSDGSNDRTDEIVSRYHHRGIQLFRVEGRLGKTQALNQAVLASRKEIIVFSEARAIFEPTAIKKLVRNFADKSVGMVSGNFIYRAPEDIVMGVSTKLYWGYESTIKRAQSRLYTLTGSMGSINAFRRHLYHVLPDHTVEDFIRPLMMLAQNHRVVYEAEALAYESTTHVLSQEFDMLVRGIRAGMMGFIYAFRHLNLIKHKWAVLQLLFHKVMRWFVPFFLVQLFMVNTYCFLNSDVFYVEVLMLLQFAFYFLGILGLFTKFSGSIGKILYLPTYFLVVNAASARALYLTLTSELDATWETNIY